MKGGRGVVEVVENWDMKEKKENKSPSEEDDASWLEKQQGILSLSLSPLLSPTSLSLSFFLAPLFHRALQRLCAYMHVIFWITHAHTSMHPSLNGSHDQVEGSPLHRAPEHTKLIQAALCPLFIKGLKIRNSTAEWGKQSQLLAQCCTNNTWQLELHSATTAWLLATGSFPIFTV